MSEALNYSGTRQIVTLSGGTPAASIDQYAENQLGIVTRYNGNLYRYVKFDNGAGNVASVAGAPAYWKEFTPSTGTYTVTTDYSDGLSGANGLAGVFLGVVTDGYYCFIQVGGKATIVVDAGTAAGDKLRSVADSTFTHTDAGTALTDNSYATALTAIDTPVAGSCYALIQGLNW